MSNRKNVLRKLLDLSAPIDDISTQLRKLEWDYEGEGEVVLEPKHISNVLGRYLKKELTKEDIEHWSNLIECREDIEFDGKYLELIKELIFKLANPALEGNITSKSCKEWQSQIIEAQKKVEGKTREFPKFVNKIKKTRNPLKQTMIKKGIFLKKDPSLKAVAKKKKISKDSIPKKTVLKKVSIKKKDTSNIKKKKTDNERNKKK